MGRFHRLAIRDHRPWRAALGFGLALVLIAVVTAVMFWNEVSTTLGALAETRAERKALLARVETLARENADLKAELTILRRQAQVREEAYQRVEADLARQGKRIGELRDEVRFYRGIFTRSLKDETLGVHGLRLRAGGVDGAYGYRLVLTHMGKGDNVVTGSLELRVRGEYEGQARLLDAGELGQGGTTQFKLKHFKQVEGDIKLPAGFVAREVEVTVRAGKKGAMRVDHSYDWSKVLD